MSIQFLAVHEKEGFLTSLVNTEVPLCRHCKMKRKIPAPDKKTLEHMATLSWEELMLFMHKKYGKKFTHDFLRDYQYRLQKLKWRKNQKWK